MNFNKLEEKSESLLDLVKEDLNALGDSIMHKHKVENQVISNIKELASESGIPNNVVSEYIDIIKSNDAFKSVKAGMREMNDKIKNKLGFNKINHSLNYGIGVRLFYIKKLCPKTFDEIANLMLSNLGFHALIDEYNLKLFIQIAESQIVLGSGNQYSMKDIIKFMEKYGDLSYDYLKFCSQFEGSYFQKGATTISEGTEKYWDYGTVIQFFEFFMNEPEATNLISFIAKNPQKLSNLGGKEIKSINLSIDSGINFAFRGILEMVKSRPDLDFPHKIKNTESDEKMWQQQWNKIIKEYEKMLRDYIAMDFSEKEKMSSIQTQRKPFDRIFFTTEYGDPVLNSTSLPRDRIKNFTGNAVFDYSTDANINDEKSGREIIFKKNNKIFELMAIQEISLQGTGIEKEYNDLSYLDKSLFRAGVKEINKGGYVYKIRCGNIVREKILENYVTINDNLGEQIFINGKREINGQKKMIFDIENYIKSHPEEKVLVCISHHGGDDGSSGNGLSREDWVKLANISPNIKIWSQRCHFGSALNNNDIYNYSSAISGFSNYSVTYSNVMEAVNIAYEKGLGFNELEIYTRLYYPRSVTPLTEILEYKNIKNKKKEKGNVGLAQNIDENSASKVRYA